MQNYNKYYIAPSLSIIINDIKSRLRLKTDTTSFIQGLYKLYLTFILRL
ncbi:hypothetical protein C7475_101779 [Chitinophaga sp. S165]|nr:hypothetical protein C7475_101779 [Chitinophaga sp. S165]